MTEKFTERKALEEYYEDLISQQTDIRLDIEMVLDRLKNLDGREMERELAFNPDYGMDIYDPDEQSEPIEDDEFLEKEHAEYVANQKPTKEEVKSITLTKQPKEERPEEYKNALQMVKEQMELDGANEKSFVDNVEDKKVIPTNLVDDLKATDNRNNFKKKSDNKNLIALNNVNLANVVGAALQEKGAPIKLDKLMSELANSGYYANNPTEAMNKAMGANKKIERVSHGYYQYRL